MAEADPVITDFAERFPDAFAAALRQGSDEEISDIVKSLPPSSVASVVARLPAARLLALLESGEHSPRDWLEDAPFDDAIMLLSRMRRERRITLIGSVRDRRLQRRFMRHQQYPRHTTGFYVEDVFLRIDIDTPVSVVLDELRNDERDDPPLMVVVDESGRYAGVLNPWHLMSNRLGSQRLSEQMEYIQPIAPETPVTAAAEHEGWLEHNWLPVVDNKHRVLGALSRATVLSAANRVAPPQQSTASLFLELVDGITHTFGEMLEGLLGRRRT
jgi:Mg/Co/Ni transporter MgtE